MTVANASGEDRAELIEQSGEIVDQGGRLRGPRAMQTRRRLLDATVELLEEQKLRDLRVIDIARRVGTSAATFYQYFRGVDDVVLCLARAASDEMPGILQHIEGSWHGAKGREKAVQIVDAFIAYWDTHHAILRARNMASDEGDARFAELRSRTMLPVIEELAQAIRAHRTGGDTSPPSEVIHPHAAAAAMASILERLAAYHRELEVFGVTRADLVKSSAQILHRTVSGE
jgi:AcrR family transcriptional regulator